MKNEKFFLMYTVYNNLAQFIQSNTMKEFPYPQQLYPVILASSNNYSLEKRGGGKKKAEQVLLTTVKLPISVWNSIWREEQKQERERDCVSASHCFHPLARIVEEVSRSASNCQAIRDKSE